MSKKALTKEYYLYILIPVAKRRIDPWPFHKDELVKQEKD